MRRLLLTFVGLASYCLCTFAQITITGKVTTSDDGLPLPAVTVLEKGTTNGTSTDANGEYHLKVRNEHSVLLFRFLGYVTQEVKVDNHKVINISLAGEATSVGEVVVTAYGVSSRERSLSASVSYSGRRDRARKKRKPRTGNESYAKIDEGGFHRLDLKPLSTFGIDVDVASYANVRRMINQGDLPPKDAVRIEEMINYFNYDYPQPVNQHPFGVHTEYTECPWQSEHRLLKIGIMAKSKPKAEVPMNNLVFLIDVSGSMNSPSKLPLVRKSLRLLVDQLKPDDRVAIVVYAGAAGAVLEPTAVRRKEKILEAIDRLSAGGSTAGGRGIALAYALAEKQLKKKANNRIILATDGDFNVGQSSDAAMQELIESKRDKGIFLTCLGFGMGNYKDSKLEVLADKGNGNYAYIDNIREAKKVLVDQMNGTLIAVAKDVKLQVEFNPDKVAAYRLIGYENRLLEDEDFKNDAKDAGDLGMGHQVTALYEIVPAGVESELVNKVERLRYRKLRKLEAQFDNELGMVKLRYKFPKEKKSIPFEVPIEVQQLSFESASTDLRFAASVAMLGMLLRDSEYKGVSDYTVVEQLARASRGEDPNGLRAELVNLVSTAALLGSGQSLAARNK